MTALEIIVLILGCVAGIALNVVLGRWVASRQNTWPSPSYFKERERLYGIPPGVFVAEIDCPELVAKWRKEEAKRQHNSNGAPSKRALSDRRWLN